ncbi:hypothetical protein [Geoalkalibacter sp.]|uniref:hypothetical protein n=1 Tax=Geoalkalibacter sp. TaxID=3041440 RepID=UPI00272EA76F|nr:hypothetical protein [Geoalkalibacter sp.]
MGKPSSPTAARWWNLIAILCILAGFAVEIYAVMLNSWAVFRTGLAIFLLCIPCAIIAFYFRHRGNIGPHPPQ